jgi:hypothetical protein
MTEHNYKTMKFVLNAEGNYDGNHISSGVPLCVIYEAQGEWVAELLNFLNLNELHDIVAFMEHLETTEDV